MEELINVNYDTQTVSAMELKEIYNKLYNQKDFEHLFNEVSKIKIEGTVEEIKYVRNILLSFCFKFDLTSLIYLKDCLECELLLPIRNTVKTKYKEKDMKEYIIQNFDIIFPEYIYIGNEVKVEKIGAIDILAECNGVKVIMELKIGNKNANKQLIAYSSAYENPILIAINEEEIDEKQKKEGIYYISLEKIVSKVNNAKKEERIKFE